MMKSTISLLQAIAIVIVFAPTSQAEGIVDAHIKAVGGQDAIAKIETIHRTGTMSGETNGAPFRGAVKEIFDLAGRRAYSSVNVAGFVRESGWTGKLGWIKEGQADVTELSADERALFNYNRGLSSLATVQATAVIEGGKRDFNGKQCAIVSVADPRVEYYVNLQSKLLEGLSLPGKLTITYEDYSAVEGLQFPDKVTLVLADQQTLVYEYAATKVNQSIDESKFNQPQDGNGDGKGKATSDDPAMEQLLAAFDTNGDRQISKEEAGGGLKEYFDTLDTDKSGLLEFGELQVVLQFAKAEAQANTTQPSGPVSAEQIVEAMDENDDGHISLQEASDDLVLFFEQYDSNADGSIDVDEAVAMAEYRNAKAAAPPADAGEFGGFGNE